MVVEAALHLAQVGKTPPGIALRFHQYQERY